MVTNAMPSDVSCERGENEYHYQSRAEIFIVNTVLFLFHRCVVFISFPRSPPCYFRLVGAEIPNSDDVIISVAASGGSFSSSSPLSPRRVREIHSLGLAPNGVGVRREIGFG